MTEILECYKDDLSAEAAELHLTITNTEVSIKEKKRFIKKLNELIDTSYEKASPYNIYEAEHQQIDELTTKMEEEMQLLAESKEQLGFCENELAEITGVLEEFETLHSENKTLLEENEELQNENDALLEREEQYQTAVQHLYQSSFLKMDDIIKRMEMCQKLVDLDPMRCKLELQYVLKMMQDNAMDLRGYFEIFRKPVEE
jgi:two-component system sensor histidine kinase DegS